MLVQLPSNIMFAQNMASQQTQGVEPVLFECWSTVYDAGPALKQHCFNALCVLAYNVGGSLILNNPLCSPYWFNLAR